MSEKVKFLVETTRKDLSAKLFQMVLDNVEGEHTVTEYKPEMSAREFLEKVVSGAWNARKGGVDTGLRMIQVAAGVNEIDQLIARAEG